MAIPNKAQATAVAMAALAGIIAVPSRDDRGRRTVILTKGCWTIEVVPEQLGRALAEARSLERIELERLAHGKRP